MEWEEINIEKCPTCGNYWSDENNLVCSNFPSCLTGKVDGISGIRLVYRIVSNKYFVEWNLISRKCHVKQKNGSNILLQLDCVIPFYITPEKLRSYILFS